MKSIITVGLLRMSSSRAEERKQAARQVAVQGRGDKVYETYAYGRITKQKFEIKNKDSRTK